MRAIGINIGAGELLDRLSILALKCERIADPARRRWAEEERALLQRTRGGLPERPDVGALAEALAAVNTLLWDVEDALRRCEAREDFGPEFIELARSVYRHNDRRAALKARLDELFGSSLREVKSYAAANLP